MTSETKYQKGDRVEHDEFGEGTVQSVERVEKPSDGDEVFYVVYMDDGRTRNLKASELSGA